MLVARNSRQWILQTWNFPLCVDVYWKDYWVHNMNLLKKWVSACGLPNPKASIIKG